MNLKGFMSDGEMVKTMDQDQAGKPQELFWMRRKLGNQAVGLAVVVPSTPNKMQPFKNLISLERILVRNEHGHFFLISPVIIPEIALQIPLLKQGRNHNPDRPENV